MGFRAGPLCILALGIASCATVGPDYREPSASTSEQWQAPIPHGGDPAAMVDWWGQFDDPALLKLIQAAEADSPSLDKAWANIASARANLVSAGSDAAPSVDASASVTRSRQQQLDQLLTQTSRSGEFDASWELDLFGKIRRNVEAAQARLRARVDDWHDARVSLAAEVADSYVQYRGCRLLADAYADELVSMQKTAEVTVASVAAGVTSAADGSLARASLASTQSSLQAQRVECDLLVKALVDLTGMQEPGVLELLGQGGNGLPKPAAFRIETVPANALRQRPDVAALERELAATSAEIGAAQADLYPSLSLSGSIARSSSSLVSTATTWSFGPTLSLPLFDGGKRRAAVESARADYQVALAEWRQGVRSAVKEVEQALVNLEGAASRTGQTARAAAEYRAYFEATEAKWRAGSASLLDLEEARRSALSAQIDYLDLLSGQVQYWIALYKAMGGGWTPDALAEPSAASRGRVQGRDDGV